MNIIEGSLITNNHFHYKISILCVCNQTIIILDNRGKMEKGEAIFFIKISWVYDNTTFY